MNLFYSNFSESQDEIVVNENDSKHIIKSYRKKIGDIIKFTNGDGLLAEARIIYKSKNIEYFKEKKRKNLYTYCNISLKKSI